MAKLIDQAKEPLMVKLKSDVAEKYEAPFGFLFSCPEAGKVNLLNLTLKEADELNKKFPNRFLREKSKKESK